MATNSPPKAGPLTLRSSFQFKLFLLFTALTAVITVFLVTLYVANEISEHDVHAQEQLQLLTETFANSVRLPLYAENYDLLVSSADDALHLPHMRVVEIFGTKGKVLVRVPAGPIDTRDCIVTTAEIRGSSLPIFPQTTFGEERNSTEQLIGQVRFYRGTDDLARNARTLVAYSCALALLGWLLVSFSCYLLLRRVTRSFEALMRGLEQVHGGDYVSRIEVRSDDEPGRASAAVNELAESLRLRAEENRRLHEELLEAMRLEISSNERLVALNQILEEEVAERNRARQELKNLVEQLPVGIIWSRTDGTVEYLNHFMLERIGYGQDEATSIETWWSLACPDPAQRQRAATLRRRAIADWGKEGISFFYDVQVVCKDGSQRQLSCSNQISGSRTVDIVIDMTDRELLQQQIIRNQKLESMGVLAGGIAHNFNNALTGVMGYISFAKKTIGESHGAYELLQFAERASKRAAGLAGQLLTFARGGAPVRKVVNVAKLVEECVSLATTGSVVAGRLELSPSLLSVLGDDGQIYQAFSCICINAVQAMPEGGVLTVRGRNVSTRKEKLPVPEEGEYVEISFQDEGCGIKEEDKPHIFTPYFTTKAQVGTGLGLATAHSIVVRHGGALNFVSAVGKGSTFTLHLPAVTAAQRETKQPVARVERTGMAVAGATILVMDDEEMIRNLARDVLEGQGYRVTLCSSGEEATALYRRAYESGAPFQAAILDLTVPGGMGGKETAQKILALDAKARLIVSSGYSNDVVMGSYRDYGFCAAYPKPYDADSLTRLLGELGLAA